MIDERLATRLFELLVVMGFVRSYSYVKGAIFGISLPRIHRNPSNPSNRTTYRSAVHYKYLK